MDSHPIKADLAGNDSIPTLASVRMAFGDTVVTQYVRLLLQDLFDFAEHQQNVDIHRVEEAAQLMASTFDYLNLAELLLFFAECKMAKYGTFYGSSGPTRVAQMLGEYCKERMASIQAEESRKHTERACAPATNEFAEYLELKQRALKGDREAQEKIRELINYKQLADE